MPIVPLCAVAALFLAPTPLLAAGRQGMHAFRGDLVHVRTVTAAALVFSMQVGFLPPEAGLARSKSSVSVAQRTPMEVTVAAGMLGAFGTRDLALRACPRGGTGLRGEEPVGIEGLNAQARNAPTGTGILHQAMAGVAADRSAALQHLTLDPGHRACGTASGSTGSWPRLAATVRTELGSDPHSGLTVVFRSKPGDRVKILVREDEQDRKTGRAGC